MATVWEIMASTIPTLSQADSQSRPIDLVARMETRHLFLTTGQVVLCLLDKTFRGLEEAGLGGQGMAEVPCRRCQMPAEIGWGEAQRPGRQLGPLSQVSTYMHPFRFMQRVFCSRFWGGEGVAIPPCPFKRDNSIFVAFFLSFSNLY